MAALSTLLPVFAMLGLGMAARIFGWVTPDQKAGANRIVFGVLFPVMIFNLLASAELSLDVLPVVGYILAMYLVALLVVGPLTARFTGEQTAHFSKYLLVTHEGGNVALPVRYIINVDVESYLDLPEQKKYHVARCIGRLNALLRDERTVLMGPGRWGTTTPSLGVPVNYTEVSHFDCLCELAYSSHGLRPELSYGSHFFQDLVEAGTFYTALYRGEAGCEFNDALFETYENRYAALLGDGAEADMEKVIRVYDTENRAILYSEVASQECFLAQI
jgi:hypothetical protein